MRASLRVEPLYHSDNPAHEQAVRDANQSALDFVGATGAAAACRSDYEGLLAFVARSGDAAGELGAAFDVDEELGPLWSQGEPDWYVAASGKQEETASDDEGSFPTQDELKKLSRRGVVAYAVRAAQRVRPLFRSEDETAQVSVNQAIVRAVLFLTEGYDSTKDYANNDEVAEDADTASSVAGKGTGGVADRGAVAARAAAAALRATHDTEGAAFAFDAAGLAFCTLGDFRS